MRHYESCPNETFPIENFPKAKDAQMKVVMVFFFDVNCIPGKWKNLITLGFWYSFLTYIVFRESGKF